MSLSFTATEIANRVKRQFGDESGVQVTDSDILNWINDSLREAALQGPLSRTTLYVDSVAGSNLLNVAADAGYALMSINSVYYKTSEGYVKLEYFSTQKMDEYVDGWDQTQIGNGEPVVYTLEGTPSNVNNLIIKVFPTPNESQANGFKLNVDTSALVTGNIGDSVFAPMQYYNYVLEYCLMKAYEMDENWEAADRKASYVQSSLNLLIGKAYAGNDKYPVITTDYQDMD